MQKIISTIKEVKNKKRYLLSFILGSMTGLAFSPIYLIPAAIAGITLHLLQLESCENKKQSFWLGWWFGWGYFVIGLYWISFALLTDIKQFGWMIPFAMLGIPAILAFYNALTSLIMHILPFKGTSRVILFASTWTIIEMLRGVLFTGFPWNLIGYIWSFSDSMLQITSITGIWGLSFLTILACAVPTTVNCNKNNNLKPTIIIFSVVLIVFVGGFIRLKMADTHMLDEKIRIVQANIDQSHKWDDDKMRDIVFKYLSMTKSYESENIKYVIWPESALPYFIDENSGIIDTIKQVIPKNGYLITGSMRAKYDDSGFVKQIWNSMHIIDSNGHILGAYDKHHLVPFGEYVPLRNILPINKITKGLTDFSTGNGVTTLSYENIIPFSPLICYEAIFPNEVIDHNNPPKLFINVTNDAWYGNSSGPYQHFNMIRVRAIEHGIPLVRAANTGISGVIDAYGQVISKSIYGQNSIIDEYIPEALNSPTFYTKFGNYTILVIILIFVLFAAIRRKS